MGSWLFCSLSSVWLEHRSYEPEVCGSNPQVSNHRFLQQTIKILKKETSNQAFLSEWSKELVLRSSIVKMRGFEPHRTQKIKISNTI